MSNVDAEHQERFVETPERAYANLCKLMGGRPLIGELREGEVLAYLSGLMGLPQVELAEDAGTTFTPIPDQPLGVGGLERAKQQAVRKLENNGSI